MDFYSFVMEFVDCGDGSSFEGVGESCQAYDLLVDGKPDDGLRHGGHFDCFFE